MLTLGVMPRGATAQVAVIDEGTFSLMSGGVRVGREDFSIRRTLGGSDGVFVAQGNVLIGDRRVAVAVNTDSSGTPLRFRLETFTAGRSTQQITGEFRRGLWSGRTIHGGGESAREFRVPRGTIAVEDGVMHELWFLLRFGSGRPTNVLVPGSLALTEILIEDAGPEAVRIGDLEIEARKWVIHGLKGAGAGREVWTDATGRLLRVRAAAEGIEALRDEPPPETPGTPRPYDRAEPTLIGP